MPAANLRLPPGPARIIPVRVGRGALARLPAAALRLRPGLVAVVSDSNVARLHAGALCRALRRAGLRVVLLVFRAGESSKTRDTKARLEDRLAELGAGRDLLVVALGGGVTGDVAGFVAATWQRGVALIQAPTSLLAMADAGLGGKTAVDLPGGKNAVGAFHQPVAVFADTALLETLPARHWREGLAEVVKSAAVADARMFRWLERQAHRLAGRDPATTERAVTGCLRVKARIVAADERNLGPRAALQFGHTVAHAIEAASGFTVTHGRAVAAGLLAEAKAATACTGFPEADLLRLRRLLADLGWRRPWPGPVSPSALWDSMPRRGAWRCALPARLGAMPGRGATTSVPRAVLRHAVAWAVTAR